MKKTNSVKNLIVLITSLSLLSGVLDKIFPNLFNLPNLNKLFSLQLDSFSSMKLWQFFTHIFFYPATHGIHLFYLINLFFGMMILNRVGIALQQHRGTKAFFSLFMFCGIISGLAAFATISHFSIPTLYAGPSNTLYCLMISLIFLFPQMDFMIFFSSPVKGKKPYPSINWLTSIDELIHKRLCKFFLSPIVINCSIPLYSAFLEFKKPLSKA